MTEMVKNSYCSYCGAKFIDWVKKIWPPHELHCTNCNSLTYNNPLPVSVSLIEVQIDEHHVGLLIQKRNIMPKKGEWAFTGGYLNFGETWQEGASREIKEELGLEIALHKIQLIDVLTATNGNILIFNKVNKVFDFEQIPFVPNDEVSAIEVVDWPMELAFPSHTEILSRWCDGNI